MKKRFKKITPYIKYFLVFFFFLFWNLIVQPVNLDEIWNYGFSHSIYRGLIPYRDFNMVITPLFPFIMSLPFHIFGSSMLVFHIEQAIILTVIFYIIDNYLKDKSYLFLVLMVFPLSVSFPSYNIFLLLLFLILIKLEDIDANDYLIGIVFACLVLTKQTVGMMMILPTFYYIKKPKKIFKRFISCLILGVIFITYLIITSSLSSFFDLCLFGLFDFAAENNKGFNIFIILWLLLLGVTFYFIKKNNNNINNYYFLAFSTLLLPLFDINHFQIVFIAFLFVLLEQKDINFPLKIKLFVVGILVGLSVVSLWYRRENDITYPNNIKYFEYRYLTNSYINYSEKISKLIDKYSDREIVFIGTDGYYFKIINDWNINYLDLLNKGNFGYNGSNKLLQELKSKKNCVFFVDKESFNESKQTDEVALDYVIENGELLEQDGSYYIYIIENK